MTSILRTLMAAGLPPIEYRSQASTSNSGTGASLTITKPSNTASGDLMVAVMAHSSGTGTWTGDTGWTEAAEFTSDDPHLRIAYKVAGGSEGASYTFTCSSSSRLLSGTILAYKYAIWDTQGTFASATGPLVAPQITVAVDNSILIAAYAATNTGQTATTPSGMSVQKIDSDANSPSYGIFDEAVDAGATGTRSSSLGGTTNNAGIIFAIKPA